MSKHDHLAELLAGVKNLDTDGPDYALHRELIRLGQAVEHDREAQK